MFYKYTFFTILVSLLFFGCSASNQNALSNKSTQKSSYVSQSGYYYALVEKNNNIWKVVDIQDTPIQIRQKTNQEILKINESYTHVEPNFDINKSNIYECNGKKGIKEYTACSSNLTGSLGAKNISELLNSSKSQRYIDEELIKEVIKQTNLFYAIENKKFALEHEECDRLFLSAKTADEFDAFIEKYSSYKYASTLIPLAEKNRDSLKMQEKRRKEEEQKNAKIYEQKVIKSEKQLERENEALANIEEKAIRNFQNNITSFRKTLKKGAETNCGPVLDIKNSSIKVYFPVKNVGNEHWIDANKIFPKTHGCRFVNGNYVAPATF